MKRLSTALAAAGLFALAGCGGGSSPSNNAASIDNTADFFNVTADDLGGNDLDASAGTNGSAGNRSAGNASVHHPAANATRPAHPARNAH